MTAQYYIVLIGPELKSNNTRKVKEVMNDLKDWLYFPPNSWIVYTGLDASVLRERLKKALAEEDPSIMVLRMEIEGWSAYSKQMSRNWLKEKRDPSIPGD